MEKYCSYCNSKIFDDDRTCPQCGAPTKNHLSKESKANYKTYYGETDASLRMVGWSHKSLVMLSQRISAWNRGRKTTVVCNKKNMLSILPCDINYRYDLTDPIYVTGFLGCDATTNDELLRKLQTVCGGTENTVYVACVDGDLNFSNVVGTIEI